MSANASFPNFLVIGAAKAGTTALYEYLRQHPDIFMSHPVKEPRFFAYEGGVPNYAHFPEAWKNSGDTVTERSAYEALFAEAANHIARGEASTLYLYYPGTAERIWQSSPDMKLVAVLRQPADRAFSHHAMLRSIGVEPLEFEQAIAAEPQRMADNWGPTWHYVSTGRYHRQLTEYLSVFPKDQLKIYLYEDFRTDPAGVMRSIFDFLGVSTEFSPDMQRRHNQTLTPKSGASGHLLKAIRPLGRSVGMAMPSRLRQFATGLVKRATMEPPARMDPVIRRDITAMLADDISALQDLIGRDLSSWLAPLRTP